MTVDLEHGGTTVSAGLVRPIHPTDNVFVHYDAEALACVINIIRDGGFETKAITAMPKGVYKRGSKMIASCIKADGKKIWKTCDSIDEAIAFQGADHEQDAEPVMTPIADGPGETSSASSTPPAAPKDDNVAAPAGIEISIDPGYNAILTDVFNVK